MSRIAYHKENKVDYVQYTCRIKSNILDKIKKISKTEDISINQVINQSLEFAINDYETNNKSN